MKPDFYAQRAALNDPRPSAPEPVGWTPIGTYTGNPPRFPEHVDPWDSAPSRMPYPASMPSPDVQGGGGPGNVDVHVRALRHVEKVTHDQSIMAAAGDHSHIRTLKTAILRRQALRQELGTGVVELTDGECRILDLRDGDETGELA